MSGGAVAIKFSEEEQQSIRMILMDGDAREALQFLKEMVWARIAAAQRKGLVSHLDRSK